MTLEINGKTYNIDKGGIKTSALTITSTRESLPIESRYHLKQLEEAKLDASALRLYDSALVDGKPTGHNTVYVPSEVAVEYDKYISATNALAYEQKKEKERNTIGVTLSTRGWGDYDSVAITIDRRDNADTWLIAAKAAFVGKTDVDEPNQSDDDLIAKINVAVSAFDRNRETAESEEMRVAELKKRASATGDKQLLKSYIDDCTDDGEECSTDIVYVYAMPDGTTMLVRQHTW